MDYILSCHIKKPLSLSSNKKYATSFLNLSVVSPIAQLNYPLQKEVLDGFEAIVKSHIKNFPDTIFWDYDYLFHLLCTSPSIIAIKKLAQDIIFLYEHYGIHSPIRFQYTHDLIFGFDWAKWVGKNPPARSQVAPFGPIFMQHLKNRAIELLHLITLNDGKYPKIPTPIKRNPFPFSRAPQEEMAVHKLLAQEMLVPIKAWEAKPVISWHHKFLKVRENLQFV